MNKIISLISDIKTSLRNNEDEDSLDKIIVFSDYDKKMNQRLIQNEHDRMTNIHNLDAYFDLVEKNDKYFNQVNEYLYNKYGRYYQKEVLKEISLARIMSKYTLEEIGELYQQHENNTQKRRV